MSRLADVLRERIRSSGPLPVEDYMRLCLAHPEHGYYRSQPAVGAAGDFITAPEISQMFGEFIGLWAAELWSTLGRPTPVRLVELGPGRGTLMADALRATAKAAAEFHAAIDLHLVEINPALKARQLAALAAARPTWHDGFGSVPHGPLIVIANEFFDALPIRQIVRSAHGWRARVVDLAGDRFVFAAGAPAADPGLAAGIGAVVERSPAGEALMREIAGRIAADRGAALVIDYGAPVRGAGDTLQAVRAHQKVSVLDAQGLADLTAHVDFTGLAGAAQAAGAAAFGPVPQGAFLRRLGLLARAAILTRTATPDQSRKIEAAVRRLIDPGEMGTLFQVLAVQSPGHAPPPGFDATT